MDSIYTYMYVHVRAVCWHTVPSVLYSLSSSQNKVLPSSAPPDDVTARVHGNLVHGVFDGSIHSAHEVYHVEPASR